MDVVVVARASDGWTALDGELSVGTAIAFVRPDDRCFVAFGPCFPEAYGPLSRTLGQHFGRDILTEIDDSDTELRRHLTEVGFVVNRREIVYAIPTDPVITGLTEMAAPAGFEVLPADQVSEDRLRVLDDELRQDVPGTDGWRWDPPGFREETYDSPQFDPTTYLVATDRSTARFAGLARVWSRPRDARLGLVAVGRTYRRRGLGRCLLAQVFGVLHERGQTEVVAEVDATNTASNTLLTAVGASRIGGSLELIHPRPTASAHGDR